MRKHQIIKGRWTGSFLHFPLCTLLYITSMGQICFLESTPILLLFCWVRHGVTLKYGIRVAVNWIIYIPGYEGTTKVVLKVCR